MNLEYAHARLQSLQAESFFIRALPTTLGRLTNRIQSNEKNDMNITKIRIHKC